MSDNIEQFNNITAQVLATLYQRFPEPATLGFAELAGLDAQAVEAEYPFVPAAFDFSQSVVQWLSDAGYIWIDLDSQLAVRARLSPRGLEALNSTPSSLSSPTPIGERLVSAVKDGAWDVARELVKEGFSAILNLATQ